MSLLSSQDDLRRVLQRVSSVSNRYVHIDGKTSYDNMLMMKDAVCSFLNLRYKVCYPPR